MVENYGEEVQDRIIPKPIQSFEEAWGRYRKYPDEVRQFISTVLF